MTFVTEDDAPSPGGLRVLLLTGVQEELLPVLDRIPFSFDEGLRAYRSRSYSGLVAATTGPGLQKKGPIKRLLQEFVPHVIVNAGLVGLLREGESLRAGDRLRLGQVTDARTAIHFPGGKGRDSLVSVERPVFEPWEKMELALHWKARACDMEAARLLQLIGQLEEVATGSVVVFTKIVGDRPESYRLFQHEELVRGWHRRSRWQQLWTGLRFPGGPLRLRELLGMKDQALQSLGRKTERVIYELIRAGGVNREIDSAFLPH